MEKLLATALLAASLPAAAQPTGQIGSQESEIELRLRLYNYARVERRVLAPAMRESDRLFREFGVRTIWLDCPTRPESLADYPACLDSPGPADLILKLLPKSMSRRYGFPRGIFGFALPAQDGTPANDISLFFERVIDLAYHGSVGTSYRDGQRIILGHMTAHEIGHLLLGPGSHAPTGVMSFPWDERTLREMECGRLRFSADEQWRIRRELERRRDGDSRAAFRRTPSQRDRE